MGAGAIPQRLVWVRDRLAVAPGDRVLEIGCGRGLAVGLICELLEGGRVTAIDRSAVAIAAAAKANADHVRAGRAVFHQTGLAELALDGERFDTAFAVNVNVFWVRPARQELAVIERLLEPGGALHLCYGYGRPGTARAADVVDKLTSNLPAGGFAVDEVVLPGAASSHMLCVTAHARA